MFDGVTKYLYSIADRSGDIHHGSGAFMFADHFRKQRLFMGGAIDDVQEAEYVAQNPGLVDLSRYGSLSEAETLYYSSAVLEYKKVGRLEKEPSQDAILVDNLNGIYGVFDGMGGQGGNPAAAAHAARDAIERALSEAPQQQSISHMLEIAKSAFVEARAAVIERGEGGSTTATTAWRTSLNGQNYWVVANAGDSRSFLYDKSTHTYESLSSNQGRGSMVYNFFEYSVFDRFHEQSDEFMVIPFDTRHRLMLCSDGITGDSESEFLTDEEFLDAFSQTNASDAAALFVDYSIKVDDKSIIIIDSELDDHA
jgi:serine/threonine protein phosphatase PrpC